jgi:hypothetical protein
MSGICGAEKTTGGVPVVEKMNSKAISYSSVQRDL